MTSFKYKAFISYSHADRDWAEWLLKSLESYKIPNNLIGRETDVGPVPTRLAPIFRDRDELPAAHRLTDRLFEALRSSEFLIVLCSPRAAKSTLVNREIVEFKKTHGDSNVLCMIVDGTPFSKIDAEECFPEALLHSFHNDGSRTGFSAEGLAADARSEGDGKRMALMKIVAGMIGVGLNDVVQRDEQRRQRNFMAAMAASFIALSVMGALTYEATSARQAASASEAIAEQKRAEAETQLAMNEELVHYMMTTMYTQLLEHGNLDALDAVSKRVLASFRGRDLHSVSSSQLFHYIGAMLRLGQSYDRRGNSDKAREIFEETLKLSRLAYNKHPDSEETIFRLQNNLFFTGYLALRQGRFEEAERDYRERLSLVHQFIDNPDNFAPSKFRHMWKPELWSDKQADAEKGLARLLSGPLGRPHEALPLHQNSIALMKKVLAARDNDPNTLVNLASAYHYAGHAYMAVGMLDQAEQVFLARKKIFEDLTAKGPVNYRALRRLYTSKQNLAKVACKRGNYQKAFELFQDAAKGFDILVAKDPANTLWLSGSAEAYYQVAKTSLILGHTDKAQAAYEKSGRQISEALSRDNSRTNRQLVAYRISALAADFDVKKGKPDAAIKKMTTLLRRLSAETNQFLYTEGALNFYAEAHLLYGQLLADKGDEEAAKEHWRMVTDTLENATATLDLDAKSHLATAHSLLGESDRAQTLVAELDRYGYHGAAPFWGSK